MRSVVRALGAVFAFYMRRLRLIVSIGVFGLITGAASLGMMLWWHSKDLPSTEQLTNYQPPTLSRVHAGDGSLIAEFAAERRLFTPIDEIPPMVKHAFISAEDKNFYTHRGVDLVGVGKALVDNVMRYARGQRLRGASTISQQVVKNFILSGEQKISRKIKEIILAWRLDGALSKDQILELYLNEVFLGSNAYGVTAASLRYFNKRLEELTPEEAAYIAALPKAPSTYHPVRRRARATARRDYVLAEMYDNGYLTRAERDAAVAKPLVTVFNKDADVGPDAAPVAAMTFFTEELRRQLSERFGETQVFGGGLSIRATVDREMQEAARRALQDRLWLYSQSQGYAGPATRLRGVDLSVAAPDAARRIADGESAEAAAAPPAPAPDAPEAEAAAEPAGPAPWQAALDALPREIAPRDVSPWRRAVVLALSEDGAVLGVDGFHAPQTLPFADVADWAAPRRGLDARKLVIQGPKPTAPAEVWTPGDVIYVAPGEDGSGWSMRQIPEVNGALMAMDAHTGRVLALQGGFSYDASKFNRATQASRQPGSSFKPFVYAAALENGYQPNSIILDSPVTLEQPDGTLWKPENYSNRFYGPSPLRFGIEKSQNLMTVRLAMDVGLDVVGGYAKRFGVYDDMPPLVSYALGAGETTLWRLVAAYGMFANGGYLLEPTLVDRIQDRRGQTIFRHDDRICAECADVVWTGQSEPFVPEEGVPLIDEVTAYQVVSMMEGVTVRGTASRSVGARVDFPVAGKTGTTNQARDAWFVGFSPDLVVGCFVGFDTPRPLGKQGSGGRLCGPVFSNFVNDVMALKKKREFQRPDSVRLVRINRDTGCAVSPGRQGRDFIWEAFRKGFAPRPGECPRGGVIGASLGAGVEGEGGAPPALGFEPLEIEAGGGVAPTAGAEEFDPYALEEAERAAERAARRAAAPAEDGGDAAPRRPPAPPAGGFSVPKIY